MYYGVNKRFIMFHENFNQALLTSKILCVKRFIFSFQDFSNFIVNKYFLIFYTFEKL
jgi:hypothetical protein